jgi:hypothetical protein
LAAARYEDKGSFVEETLRRCETYSRRATGNHRHFSLQLAHGIRLLPSPLHGFPVVCSVAADDMSNSGERKMIAHRHDHVGRDTVQNGHIVADGSAMSSPPVDGGGPERRLPDRLKLLAHVA